MSLQRGQATENDSRVLVLSLEKTTRYAAVAVLRENMLAALYYANNVVLDVKLRVGGEQSRHF